MKISVVAPLHNEEAALPQLIARLRRTLEALPYEWEVILVDDGSSDGTWRLLTNEATADARFRGLRLTRNFGHQRALSAGLDVADGDAIISMDGDLQHPPEVLPTLIAKSLEGHDVVYAIRSEDDREGWFKIHTARLFYWLFNLLTRLDLPPGAGDFRVTSRRALDVLLAMPERSRFLRGMTRWTGFEQSTIYYDRADRQGGASKYTLGRMVRFAADAIVAFSAWPLRIASMFGIFFSLMGGLYLIYVLYVRLFTDDSLAGWTSVVVVTLILGGVQLACLGIIGQYLGRIYDEVKGRPVFLVLEDTALTARRPAGVPETDPTRCA
ncbi:MAG: glycosyltransferase family 2 protein [Solirubrobacterales bacterium]